MMTQEDKYWIAGGAALAIGGGIYWYTQNQKAKEEATAVDGTYIDAPTTSEATTQGSSTSTVATKPKTTTPQVTTRQPDPIRYYIGNEVQAGPNGAKTYIPKKSANGNYTNTGVSEATFKTGDAIGKIIWVGAVADGTFRYVIERDGTYQNRLYWVTDYRLLSPINKTSLPKSTTPAVAVASLNPSLLLQKGSKGAEVRELQKRLGIYIDGDFGANTLAALQKQKGVSQITLAAFATTKPVITTSGLDFNKLLKVGSKGLEVKELQKRLGFSGSNVDGDFGTKTKNALYAIKKVYQITLNQY